MKPPSESTTLTPRTDSEQEDARNVALEFTCRNPAPKEGENVVVVPAEFARQLERELAQCAQTILNHRAFINELESCHQAAVNDLSALKRGEFVCSKCGIRKDSDHDRGYF